MADLHGLEPSTFRQQLALEYARGLADLSNRLKWQEQQVARWYVRSLSGSGYLTRLRRSLFGRSDLVGARLLAMELEPHVGVRPHVSSRSVILYHDTVAADLAASPVGTRLRALLEHYLHELGRHLRLEVAWEPAGPEGIITFSLPKHTDATSWQPQLPIPSPHVSSRRAAFRRMALCIALGQEMTIGARDVGAWMGARLALWVRCWPGEPGPGGVARRVQWHLWGLTDQVYVHPAADGSYQVGAVPPAELMAVLADHGVSPGRLGQYMEGFWSTALPQSGDLAVTFATTTTHWQAEVVARVQTHHAV